ncbi:MAG: hypothetical protein IT184_06160 [Acidobacteria bacterium]|nr:hypothetical protein [Acidobacteriota bacterium]
MPSDPKSGAATDRRHAAGVAASARPAVAVVSVVAWLVPGAAHVWQGHVAKGAVFFVVLLAMFGIGLACGGRLFPLQPGDVLVFLAGLAEYGLGLPRLAAAFGGWGAGDLVAASYEYGNTFLIAAGLLNALVVLDAVDLATGRKS